MDEIARYLDALRALLGEDAVAEISDHLLEAVADGLSPEEAVEAFGPPEVVAEAYRGSEAIMFERFTQDARSCIVQAQEEARELRHNHIGTEHLLLGILRVAPSPDLPIEDVRRHVVAIVGTGAQDAGVGHLPFTPRSKKVLEMALRGALRRGHPVITPDHLLIALVEEGEGVAVQAIDRCGLDRTAMRAAAEGRLPEVHTSLLEADLDLVRREKDEAIERGDYDAAARLREREKYLLKQGADLERAIAEVSRPLGIQEGELRRILAGVVGRFRRGEPATPDPARLIADGLDQIGRGVAALVDRLDAAEKRIEDLERGSRGEQAS